MAEFNIRSDSVDVERIMQQIRARIREKRGTDYTEDDIRQLASVKLEKFLDPRSVRSDLTEHYRRQRRDSGPLPPPPPLPPLPQVPASASVSEPPPRPPSVPESAPWPAPFELDPDIIYRSSRGALGRLLHLIRKLLNPLLKLFFNPTPLVHALHRQTEINSRQIEFNMRQNEFNMRQNEFNIRQADWLRDMNLRQAEQVDWMIRVVHQHGEYLERLIEHLSREVDLASRKFALREELDALNYEVLNNLVVEMTRLSIDLKNHQMRVESIAGRLDFDERRARALETVVQYRSTAQGLAPASAEGGATPATPEGAGPAQPGAESKRRRRRRRGRRRTTADATSPAPDAVTAEPAATAPPDAAAEESASSSESESDDDTGTSEP